MRRYENMWFKLVALVLILVLLVPMLAACGGGEEAVEEEAVEEEAVEEEAVEEEAVGEEAVEEEAGTPTSTPTPESTSTPTPLPTPTPTPAPPIAVTSPNGGENWITGTTQTITWTSAGLSGQVKIELSRDGGTTWKTIIFSTPNDGSQPWKVTGQATTEARIRVVSVTNRAVLDVSDANLSIGLPSITVVSPNGGDNWAIGTTQKITWTSDGLSGSVKIELSRDGGTTWKTIIFSTPNDGSQPWKVIGQATTEVRIRVVSVTNRAVFDISDAIFTISQPTPTPTPTLTPSTPTPLEITMVLSDKQRVTLPSVAASDLTDLVHGNSAFAFDLYKALSAKDGNLFYSPYSISLALAMTYAGARSETEQQMANTLHFILPQDRLHPAFNALDQELASRGQGAKGTDEKGFRLNVANAIWGQQDYRFLGDFLDVLAENYGAGLRLLDFSKVPEECRITINNWVSDQTEGKIKDLIPQGVIDELTRLVLTNAIYFNAAWLNPFDKSSTQDGVFHLLDGSEVTVPMMSQTASFSYAKGKGYQAVELPYDGNELSMVILLPDTGEFKTFEGSLDAEQVNSIIKNLEPRQVALSLPKFKFESEFGLTDTLSAMGMPIAFTQEADFSGMTGNRELAISEILHKAFVSVDEAGTEAAAATAVIVGLTSMPQEPVTVTLDRPFIFLVRDIETGAILFIGRVMNPGEKTSL